MKTEPGRWLWPFGVWGAALAFLAALVLSPAAGAAAADKPGATLSQQQGGKGGDITVTGTGWRPDALLMMLICGQASPARGVIGGTNSCANADGRAVTTGSKGTFSKKLPVAEPPQPCPCVVHIATVTGEQATADVVFKVAGHPVAALPKPAPGGRLAVLSGARLGDPAASSPGSGRRPAGRSSSPWAISARRPSRTRSSPSARRTVCSPRSGRTGSGTARSHPAGRRGSSWTPNCRRAPTATTRSR